MMYKRGGNGFDDLCIIIIDSGGVGKFEKRKSFFWMSKKEKRKP